MTHPPGVLPLHKTAVRVLWGMARLHTLTGRCTFREIVSLTGIDLATVYHHAESLEALGLAERYSATPLWRPRVSVVAEGFASSPKKKKR